MEQDNETTSISHAKSLEEIAEFWDTHDATDFDDQTHEVAMTFAASNSTDDDLIDELVEQSPDFLESIRVARQQIAEGKVLTLAEVRAKYKNSTE
jgi:hypothetical protein